MACANPVSPLQLTITDNVVTIDGKGSVRGIGIGLGTPEQVLSLLPTTSENDLFVFNVADCGPSSNDSCIAQKGGVFDLTKSHSFIQVTEDQWDGFPLSEEENTGGYIFFNDTLWFGSDGVYQDFPAFMDRPGQGTQAGLPLGPNSTFVKAAYDAGKAPSQFWGLWPGTTNINDPMDGLLVIGGYDAYRVNGDWVEFPTGEYCYTCASVVELSYVWSGGSTSLLANSSDSLEIGLDPFWNYIQLRQDMFEKFTAASLGTWDPDYQGLTYDINNPPTGNISVTLASGNQLYQITIPNEEIFSMPRGYTNDGVYAIENDSVIISLVSVNTETDNVAAWGMPFLTMNYMVVDYDNGTFNLAPAYRDDLGDYGESPDISTICGPALPTNSAHSTNHQSPNPTHTHTPTLTPTPHPSHTGAIVGGVVGGVLGLALIICGFGYLFWRSNRKNRVANQGSQQTLPPAYAQSEGPDGSSSAKPAVSEVGDPRASMLTNSAPTEYSELASPQQASTEFNQNKQGQGWLQKQEPIHEEESKPIMGATSGPINEPVEMPTDRH